MRSHLRESLLLAATTMGFLAPVAALASSSPTQLLKSILAAARAQRSVHYTTAGRYGVTVTGAAVSVDFVGDAGVSQGIQRITFHKGTQTGHVTVLVSANTAYVRGDAFTLVNFMGFKTNAAAKYAGVWILIPHTANNFSTVAAGVRLSSTIDEISFSGQLTRVSSTTIDGQRVVGVRGTQTSNGLQHPATLYARAVGPPLPVKEIASEGSTSLTAIFSKWNEPLQLATPKSAVPISTVLKTP